MPDVLGWDSETPLGYVALLANSRGEFVETSDTIALLDFLFERGFDADYNVFWNVKFDFGAIVKPWVVAKAADLKQNHLRGIRLRKEIALASAAALVSETEPTVEELRAQRDRKAELEELETVEHFDLGKYRVLYLPKKGFRITRAHRKRGKNSVTFFDAMPFYSTGISEAAPLDATAKKHLGEGKNAESEGVDRAEIGRSREYYAAHRDAIVRYCVRDCQLTARLFEKTIAGFEAIGVAFPEQPWSRASVGRQLLKDTGVLETTREAYDELSQVATAYIFEKAYAGACILTRGVGTFDDVSEWDINSAYPAPMPEFPSLDGAYLVGPESSEFDGCYFKFYEIDLTPTPRRALPAKDGARDRLVYHAGGPPRRVCVTQLDLDAFDRWGDSYTVVRAVGVVTPSPDRPLAFMARLYREKDEIKARFGKDSVEYQNIKIMLNGTYGILTQSRPRRGRYTNFIYGAYITAWCRRELWRKAKEVEGQGGTVLNFKTDGMLVSGLSTLPPSSHELGAWEVEFVGSVTIFANGIYWIPSHATPKSDGLKKRGAPTLSVPDLRACRRPWVEVTRSGPMGLKPAIIQGCPEQIGVWSTETKDLIPWRMLEDSGLRMPPDLRAAPLADYFTRSWMLDHRHATEIVSEPHRLLITLPESEADE